MKAPTLQKEPRPQKGTCLTPLGCKVTDKVAESRDSHVGGEDPVDEVLLGQVEGTLQLVVVEGDLTRAGAVEPGLHECGPCVLQQEAAPHVILAHSGHPRIHGAPTVMLHGVLPQEEVCKQPNIIGRHKVWFWQAERGKKRIGPGRRGQSQDYVTISIFPDGHPDTLPFPDCITDW